MTVNKIVSDRIINKLKTAEEKGTTYYWIKPFAEGSPKRAYSYDTSIAYTGVNRLLLDADEYLTYNKILELNKQNNTDYHIRKGAQTSIVVYYNTIILKDDNGEPIIDERTKKPAERGFLKYYRVFSRQDVVNKEGKNLESKFDFKHYTREEITEQMRKSLDDFHKIINTYCQNQKIDVEIISDGTEAYFAPERNLIRFPKIDNFKSLYEYMHTIAHELIHSTMLPLGRKTTEVRDPETAIKNYSKEELIAEIGAEMLLQNLCIPDDREYKENSIAYLQGWSKYLEDKPNEIVSACAKAETACNYIFDYVKEIEKSSSIDEVERDG